MDPSASRDRQTPPLETPVGDPAVDNGSLNATRKGTITNLSQVPRCTCPSIVMSVFGRGKA